MPKPSPRSMAWRSSSRQAWWAVGTACDRETGASAASASPVTIRLASKTLLFIVCLRKAPPGRAATIEILRFAQDDRKEAKGLSGGGAGLLAALAGQQLAGQPRQLFVAELALLVELHLLLGALAALLVLLLGHERFLSHPCLLLRVSLS